MIFKERRSRPRGKRKEGAEDGNKTPSTSLNPSREIIECPAWVPFAIAERGLGANREIELGAENEYSQADEALTAAIKIIRGLRGQSWICTYPCASAAALAPTERS